MDDFHWWIGPDGKHLQLVIEDDVFPAPETRGLCYRYTGPTTAPLSSIEPAPSPPKSLTRDEQQAVMHHADLVYDRPAKVTARKLAPPWKVEITGEDEPTPTSTPPKPEWLKVGVRVRLRLREPGLLDGWMLGIDKRGGTPVLLDDGSFRKCDVRTITIVPHPDNDPELAAAIENG